MSCGLPDARRVRAQRVHQRLEQLRHRRQKPIDHPRQLASEGTHQLAHGGSQHRQRVLDDADDVFDCTVHFIQQVVHQFAHFVGRDAISNGMVDAPHCFRCAVHQRLECRNQRQANCILQTGYSLRIALHRVIEAAHCGDFIIVEYGAEPFSLRVQRFKAFTSGCDEWVEFLCTFAEQRNRGSVTLCWVLNLAECINRIPEYILRTAQTAVNVRDADTQRRKLVRGFAAAVERIAHRLCELGHAAGYRIDARINEVACI